MYSYHEYHSISVNRRGTISHEAGNSQAAFAFVGWQENTFSKTYHWNFTYDPGWWTYPGALGCLTRESYADAPPKRVIDTADEHYRKLIEIHKGDISMLEYFSGDDYADVRRRVAMYIDSLEMLRALAKDMDMDVRWAIAANNHTPPIIQMDLARSEHLKIRHRIAARSNVSQDVLSVLSKDKEIRVRLSVAANPATSAETLTSLAKDGNWQIRAEVINNPSTPDQVSIALAR